MSSTIHTNIGAHVKTVTGTVPVAASAGTRNGTGIDRTGYNSLKLHGQTGAVSGGPSAQTADFKIQDSADDSSYADYTPPNGSASTAQITAANSSASVSVDLSSARKYVRVVETVALTGGTTPTMGVGSTVVLGGAKTLPAT